MEIWVEVHGKDSSHPPRCAGMMKACDHASVGLCWNSNPPEVDADGSILKSFALLKPWIRSCHINELADARYPWRQLFALLRSAGYDRWTLAEIQGNAEPERLLRYYKRLWEELQPAGE